MLYERLAGSKDDQVRVYFCPESSSLFPVVHIKLKAHN